MLSTDLENNVRALWRERMSCGVSLTETSHPSLAYCTILKANTEVCTYLTPSSCRHYISHLTSQNASGCLPAGWCPVKGTLDRFQCKASERALEVPLFTLYKVTWVSAELHVLRKHVTGVNGCSVFLREKSSSSITPAFQLGGSLVSPEAVPSISTSVLGPGVTSALLQKLPIVSAGWGS